MDLPKAPKPTPTLKPTAKPNGGRCARPARKEQRAAARIKERSIVKDNSYDLRLERIQRKREELELAEEQRSRRRARMARENGMGFHGQLDTCVRRVKALMKMKSLKDMELEMGVVVLVGVFGVAMIFLWIQASAGIKKEA